MDPCRPGGDAQSAERIDALIRAYFERRKSGESLTPEQFAAEHPESAQELLPYLKGLGILGRILPVTGDRAGPEHAGLGLEELPGIPGYRVLEEIGRGGMGVAYKALQLSTQRVVALKVMSAGPLASPSARRRFEREVRLAARLQHPSIVRILESDEVLKQRYYAMDYVPGVPLNDYLGTAQPDVRAILGLFEQICAAVDYAHGQGVVHRDIKPANVLVDDEGSAHILDFGLAKAADQAEEEEAVTTCVSLPGQVLGTLFYLSPEQAVGNPEEIDARTDVYALGVMLFESLTGSLPFDMKGRPSQVIQRILESPPPRPSSLSERVDDEIETIILKALEKDRSRRYQSAKEMGEDLRRYLEGDPILAERPSSLYILRKKLGKHRFQLAVTAAVVGLIVIGLLAGGWWRQHESARARQAAWQNARRAALLCQRNLERGSIDIALGNAQILYDRYWKPPDAPLEVYLIWVQAFHRFGPPSSTPIRELEQALEENPSCWACRALLVEIYRKTGEETRADTVEAQATGDIPDTGEAWYLRSYATLDAKRALQCAREAVQRRPSHTLAWERLTYLRQQTGNLDGALQGADRLIDLGEPAERWLSFKGEVLAAQGRFEESLDQYNQAIAECPRSYAFVLSAHAYRRLGEYDQAVAHYTKALNAVGEPPDVWILFQRATPLWMAGRPEEAVEDYRRVRVLRGRPSYADVRRFLILRELHRSAEAEEVLDAALRDIAALRNANDDWLRQIFRCLDGQLTPEELVNEAVERENRECRCEAYYYAGEVCLLLNRRAEAREWFRECVATGVDFDPDTAPATPMNEYELAQWRLDTLFTAPSTLLPEEN